MNGWRKESPTLFWRDMLFPGPLSKMRGDFLTPENGDNALWHCNVPTSILAACRSSASNAVNLLKGVWRLSRSSAKPSMTSCYPKRPGGGGTPRLCPARTCSDWMVHRMTSDRRMLNTQTPTYSTQAARFMILLSACKDEIGCKESICAYTPKYMNKTLRIT